MASQSGFSVVARAYWMALGNLLAVILLAQIAGLPPWTFSWRDVAVAAVAVSLVGSRTLDVVKLGGTNVYGEPATQSDVVRYAVGVIGLCTAAWVGAQATTL